MSESSPPSDDDDIREWEFIKKEEAMERSEDESVEIINDFSSQEDESCPEDGIDALNGLNGLNGGSSSLNSSVDSLSDPNQILELFQEPMINSTVNLQDILISVTVMIAISSVGLAMTAGLLNIDENQRRWNSRMDNDEMGGLLRELHKYKAENAFLNEHIVKLQNVIDDLKVSLKNNEDKLELMKNSSMDNHVNNTMSNLTDTFLNNGKKFQLVVTKNIEDLNNQVAHNILKTCLKMRKKMFKKICSFGPYQFIHEQECMNNLPNFKNLIPFDINGLNDKEISDRMSALINGISKENAYSWMQFYENILENKLNMIKKQINKNLKQNNKILDQILKNKNFDKCHCKKNKEYKKRNSTKVEKHPKKDDKKIKYKKPKKEKRDKMSKSGFYFDKKKWKYVKNNKTEKHECTSTECFINKTIDDMKKNGYWFTDLGIHRSFIRGEKSKSDWIFNRARGRRSKCDFNNAFCFINNTIHDMKRNGFWFTDMGIHRSMIRGKKRNWQSDSKKNKRILF